uniref:ATP synthase subunit a n=1 Tax=Haementeria acuecueyetzin TaxID=1130134 RepID=A0A7D7PIY5_9ANNE|nr:ATP synthase F0 subunit 6 [Haementeria acuecueyetzin]
MMPDIFSSFDIYEFYSNWSMPKTFILMMLISLTLTMFNFYWSSMNRYSTILSYPMNIIFSQLMRTNSKYIKAYSIILFNAFIIIIIMNLMGMIPFTFSITTHLMFTLSLGLPLWLSIILSSFMYNNKEFIAKLLPDGAPNWLNPFLVLIETISISVRPLTLSFRLAANMTAGHIVLSLLGIYTSLAICTSYINSLFLILMTLGYILFEFAICIIQAYIFCLLLSLYTDDHSNQ